MERIFVFIESLAQENVRIENSTNEYRSKIEKNVLSLMQGSFMTVFGQLSPSIFMVLSWNIMIFYNYENEILFSSYKHYIIIFLKWQVALKKIYNYSLGKIFEREVAGQAIAIMVKAFARVRYPSIWIIILIFIFLIVTWKATYNSLLIFYISTS